MNPFRRRQFTAMQSGGGAAAFSPTDIAGLRIWQDAAQITGLNDGDAVATWSDASGNGLDLTAPSVSARPIYKTAIFGSQPAVLFDGVDDHLQIASYTFSLTAGTIFAVYRATANSYAVVRVNNDLDGTYWRYAGDGNGYWPLFRVHRLPTYPAAMPGSGVGVYVVDVSTATQKEVWVNGVSKGTQASTFQSPDRAYMGGATGSGGPGMSGYVAEWGMYDSALSGANLTALQNYLAAKYGL